MKTKIILILALFTSMTILGQTTIKGTVTDAESGEGIPGAILQVENTYLHATTDENGNFSLLLNAKITELTLITSMIGYSDDVRTLKQGDNISLQIQLQRKSILTDEVVISANRVPRQAPATLTTISRKEIAQRSTASDLPYLLEQSPSTVTTSDGGSGVGYTGIRIRGSDMTRINVTIDGMPYNNPESHEVYWVDIPDIASSIDNVQIQRGVGTSGNGVAAFGASINIETTQLSESPYAELSSDAGSFNTFKNTLRLGSGTLKEHWSVDARISKVTSNGYIDRATSDLQSIFLTGNWFNKNNRLKATVLSGKERTYQAWDGVSSEVIDTNRTYNRNGLYYDASGQAQFYENEVDDYKQNHYLLSYSHQFGKSTAVSLGLHYTHGEGYYEEYEEDKFPRDYIQFPHQNDTLHYVDFITRKWLNNDFTGITASVNTAYEHLNLSAGMAYNYYQGNHFGKVIWSSASFVEPTFDYEWYRNTGDKSDFNVFAKGTYALNHGISLLCDLQYRAIDYAIKGTEDAFSSIDTHNQYRFFNPKAGISWQPANEHRVQFYTGIANREPSRSNFTDADAGETPRPERLMNVEAGYNYTRTHWAASVNLYYMNYKDQLVLTGEINQVGAPIMVNVDKSYRAGIELGWGYQPSQFLDWKGNITLSRNKIPEYVSYVDNWDVGDQVQDTLQNADLSFSPGFIAGSTVTLKPLKSITIEWISKFVGKQYLDNTSSENRKLDPYFVNNLRFTYSPKVPHTNGFSLYLQLNNILNEQYETNGWVYRYHYNGMDQKMDGLFPQAGLNFIAGLRISL